MERGDTDLGRGAYGQPRRRRLGDRRGYRPGGRAGGTGTRGTSAVDRPGDDADEEYDGQLLRRPGDPPGYPREPRRPRMRQPGRSAPAADGYPPGGDPTGYPGNGTPTGYPGSGNQASGFPANVNPGDGYPSDGKAATGGPRNGGPASAAGYRGPAGGAGYRGPVSPAGYGGPASGAGYGAPASAAGPVSGEQYRRPNGRRVPPAVGRVYRPPGPGSAGGTHRRHGPGQDPLGGMWRRPAAAPAQSVTSIAPDGAESFARDLRALRAKAELDYPELAELSHYTMKTLASAAGGLRLPTLPVAVAYVRACGGNVTEWEDRWQKLAAKLPSDEAKKHRSDDDEQQARPEPADAPAITEPPAVPAAEDPDPRPGEVYVITSAKPRPPGW